MGLGGDRSSGEGCVLFTMRFVCVFRLEPGGQLLSFWYGNFHFTALIHLQTYLNFFSTLLILTQNIPQRKWGWGWAM